MIKKLLYLVIIVFSVYGVYICYTEGFERNLGIVNIDIPNFEEVKDNKSQLDTDLTELNTLNSTGISSAISKVETEIQNYEAKKQEYDMLALSASRDEIAEANKIEKYLLDYLWIRIGNYASNNNVKFKMTPNETEASLTFDVTGAYISVINFIYDIENDTELNFGISGIVLEGGSSSNVVKANFKVYDVNVITAPEQ